MKVFLVQTALEVIEESYHDALNAGYPLGLGYLHSYLEQQGHEVRTRDLSNQPLSENLSVVFEAVENTAPDVIGLQILTSNRCSSFALIDALRAEFPEIRVVVGGIHVSEMYSHILERFPWTIAVIGEGELTFAEMLTALGQGQSLETVPGLALSMDGRVVVTPKRPPIEDLDSLPFPKHEAFITEKDAFASLLTTRGCPFTCSFCAVARRDMRFRSVANVVDEIEYISKRFPHVRAIRIWDDQFFYKPARVIEICEEIVRRGIRLQFICMARLKPCTREMVLALEKAGFVQLLFGLESGATSVLANCSKGIRLDDAVRTLGLFVDSNIDISMFLIVGLEGENRSTVLETAAFVQQLQGIKYFPGWANVGLATIYPGTDLYRRAVQRGLMSDDYWSSDAPVPLFTAEHSGPELMELLELLLDHIDPLRMLESEAAFLAQRQLIPSLLKFLLNWQSRDYDAYWSRREVAPLLNMLAEVMDDLDKSGDLRLLLGSSTMRMLRRDGKVSFPVLMRKPGQERSYVYELVDKSASQILMTVLADISRRGPAPVFDLICKAFDKALERHWLERKHEAVEPRIPPHLTEDSMNTAGKRLM